MIYKLKNISPDIVKVHGRLIRPLEIIRTATIEPYRILLQNNILKMVDSIGTPGPSVLYVNPLRQGENVSKPFIKMNNDINKQLISRFERKEKLNELQDPNSSPKNIKKASSDNTIYINTESPYMNESTEKITPFTWNKNTKNAVVQLDNIKAPIEQIDYNISNEYNFNHESDIVYIDTSDLTNNNELVNTLTDNDNLNNAVIENNIIHISENEEISPVEEFINNNILKKDIVKDNISDSVSVNEEKPVIKNAMFNKLLTQNKILMDNTSSKDVYIQNNTNISNAIIENNNSIDNSITNEQFINDNLSIDDNLSNENDLFVKNNHSDTNISIKTNTLLDYIQEIIETVHYKLYKGHSPEDIDIDLLINTEKSNQQSNNIENEILLDKTNNLNETDSLNNDNLNNTNDLNNITISNNIDTINCTDTINNMDIANNIDLKINQLLTERLNITFDTLIQKLSNMSDNIPNNMSSDNSQPNNNQFNNIQSNSNRSDNNQSNNISNSSNIENTIVINKDLIIQSLFKLFIDRNINNDDLKNIKLFYQSTHILDNVNSDIKKQIQNANSYDELITILLNNVYPQLF